MAITERAVRGLIAAISEGHEEGGATLATWQLCRALGHPERRRRPAEALVLTAAAGRAHPEGRLDRRGGGRVDVPLDGGVSLALPGGFRAGFRLVATTALGLRLAFEGELPWVSQAGDCGPIMPVATMIFDCRLVSLHSDAGGRVDLRVTPSARVTRHPQESRT